MKTKNDLNENVMNLSKDELRKEIESSVLLNEKMGNFINPLNCLTYFDYVMFQKKDDEQSLALNALLTPSYFAEKDVQINEIESTVHNKIKSNSNKVLQRFHKPFLSNVYYDLDDGVLVKHIIDEDEKKFLTKSNIIGDNLLAAVIVNKYCFWYTIDITVQRFKACGIGLSHFDLCSSIDNIAKELKPVFLLLKQDMLKAKVISIIDRAYYSCDGPYDKDHMEKHVSLIITASRDNHQIVCFDYPLPIFKSGGIEFDDFIKDYEGFIKTSFYYRPTNQDFCLSLGRFEEVLFRLLQEKNVADDSMVAFTYKRIGRYIKKLWQIDNNLRSKLDKNEITEEEFVELRKQESLSVIDKLVSWCEGRVDIEDTEYPIEIKGKRGNLLTENIREFLDEIDLYKKYLECASVEPHCSDLEEMVLNINYKEDPLLYIGYENQSEDVQIFDSFIKTAMVNDIDPYEYLAYLIKEVKSFREMDEASRDYARLLPWNISSDILPRKCIVSI